MSVSNTDEMDEESRSLKSRAQNANSKIETTYGIVSRVNNKCLCRLPIGGIQKKICIVCVTRNKTKAAFDAATINKVSTGVQKGYSKGIATLYV